MIIELTIGLTNFGALPHLIFLLCFTAVLGVLIINSNRLNSKAKR